MGGPKKVPSPAPGNATPSRLRILWEYIFTLVIMALIVFSARSSLADWYEVPSGSMLPTIQIGDRIFVNKLAYDLRIPFTSVSLWRIGEPERGDIVVFEYPVDNRTDYVKRLIGLPGDIVEVRNNELFINGRRFPRREIDQAQLPPGAELGRGLTLYLEDVDDVTHYLFQRGQKRNGRRIGARRSHSYASPEVPEDMYFVMGDNRDNSSDSRAWPEVCADNDKCECERCEFVPRENLRGRALRVVISFDPDIPLWNPKRIRFDRLMLPLDPSMTSQE